MEKKRKEFDVALKQIKKKLELHESDPLDLPVLKDELKAFNRDIDLFIRDMEAQLNDLAYTTDLSEDLYEKDWLEFKENYLIPFSKNIISQIEKEISNIENS